MMQTRLLPAFAVCALALTSCLPAGAKPPLTVLEHPSPEELERGFEEWLDKYSEAFSYEKRGETPEGRPILMGCITDRRVPSENKQIALLTSCHVAKELNAGTGLLRFMKWLLGDDPAAADIRRNQIVLIVPYTDPTESGAGNSRSCVRSMARPIAFGVWMAFPIRRTTPRRLCFR